VVANCTMNQGDTNSSGRFWAVRPPAPAFTRAQLHGGAPSGVVGRNLVSVTSTLSSQERTRFVIDKCIWILDLVTLS